MYVLRIPSEVISLDVLYFIFSAYFQISVKKIQTFFEIRDISCKKNSMIFRGRGD